MNRFIESQCQNMLQSIAMFKQSCEFAAKRDDGQISKDEAKTLKKITTAADNFAKELGKILNH